MEIVFLFVGWLALLYIIHLHKELSAHKKYLQQHDKIYVPSYNEIINQNNLLQVVRFVLNQFKREESNDFRIVPFVRKKINLLNPLAIWGKKLD